MKIDWKYSLNGFIISQLQQQTKLSCYVYYHDVNTAFHNCQSFPLSDILLCTHAHTHTHTHTRTHTLVGIRRGRHWLSNFCLLPVLTNNCCWLSMDIRDIALQQILQAHSCVCVSVVVLGSACQRWKELEGNFDTFLSIKEAVRPESLDLPPEVWLSLSFL